MLAILYFNMDQAAHGVQNLNEIGKIIKESIANNQCRT